MEKKKKKKTEAALPYLEASAAGSAAITSPSPPTLDQGATSVATKTTCIAPDASVGADWTTAGTMVAGGGIGFRRLWLVVADFVLLLRFFFFFFLLAESAAPPAATAATATLQTATALAGGVAEFGFLFQRSGSDVLAACSRVLEGAERLAEAGGRVGCGLVFVFKAGGDANAG